MDLSRLTFVDVATIVYAALSVLGLFIALIVLIALFRTIGRFWSRSGNLFGSDTQTLLIGLGVAALLFPRVFAQLATALFYFISNFFINAPNALINSWQTAIQSSCLNMVGGYTGCEGQLSLGFTGAWGSAFSNALARFGPSYLSYSQ
jgi:hypothetical protein